MNSEQRNGSKMNETIDGAEVAGLTRRRLLTRGAIAAAAGAVAYSAPTVASAQGSGGPSAVLPSILSISNSTPNPGDTVTVTALQIPAQRVRVCMPGFIPTAVFPGGGAGGADEIDAVTLEAPGIMNMEIAIAQFGDAGDLTGANHPPVVGLDFTLPGAVGAALELDPADIVMTPVQVTVGVTSGTELPSTLNGSGEIEVDCNGPTFIGGERFETEFHIDTTDGRHADYTFRDALLESAGSADVVAALIGEAIKTGIKNGYAGSSFSDIDFSVTSGIVTVFLAGARSISKIHALSHVVVM